MCTHTLVLGMHYIALTSFIRVHITPIRISPVPAIMLYYIYIQSNSMMEVVQSYLFFKVIIEK
jgi:hypothetical protein